MTEAIRIAVLNFAHETVTFLPNDTTLDDFVYDDSPARGEALLVLGMRLARQPPDERHPFGHGKNVYFWAFVVSMMLFTLGGGHAERIRDAPLRLQEPVGAEVAGDLADLLGEDRGVLDPVPVAVDDGMREPLADLCGRMVRAHLAPPRPVKFGVA